MREETLHHQASEAVFGDAGRRVTSVDPPPESRLAALFGGADLVDAFAVAIPADATRDITAVAEAIFGHPAWWFRTLLAVRDAVAAGFGLKTTQQIRRIADKKSGDRIDFFPVLSRSGRELIIGEDDRHLDFRASILVRPLGEGREFEVVATTVVHCHNRPGRCYLTLILPFHRRVVRSSLRRAALALWSP
ncbi:MAG: DUF2867 domain-containing protein [Azospirillaceae bacterium]|nr:DUF2867 domain-containing protein [Azospirillaceae bacterium]